MLKKELIETLDILFPQLDDKQLKVLKDHLHDISDEQVEIFLQFSKKYDPLTVAINLGEINFLKKKLFEKKLDQKEGFEWDADSSSQIFIKNNVKSKL